MEVPDLVCCHKNILTQLDSDPETIQVLAKKLDTCTLVTTHRQDKKISEKSLTNTNTSSCK